MRVRRLAAPLLAAVATAAVTIAPGAALASAGNAATTDAYLQADYALVRVARSHLATSEAAPLHILSQVRSECPQAGAGSPQDAESTQMSNEVIGDMVLSAGLPDRPAVSAFISAVSHLSWSNHGLSSAVHTYAADLKTLMGLHTPNLCGDVKAWAANGYHTLPASTVTFDAKFMPAWVALGLQPKQLSSYENSEAKSLASRANKLEEMLTEAEARAVEHWGEIMNTLMINP